MTPQHPDSAAIKYRHPKIRRIGDWLTPGRGLTLSAWLDRSTPSRKTRRSPRSPRAREARTPSATPASSRRAPGISSRPDRIPRVPSGTRSRLSTSPTSPRSCRQGCLATPRMKAPLSTQAQPCPQRNSVLVEGGTNRPVLSGQAHGSRSAVGDRFWPDALPAAQSLRRSIGPIQLGSSHMCSPTGGRPRGTGYPTVATHRQEASLRGTSRFDGPARSRPLQYERQSLRQVPTRPGFRRRPPHRRPSKTSTSPFRARPVIL
jgi:hypothetical protein